MGRFAYGSLLVCLGLLVASASCIGHGVDVEIANWPHGHKSAVCITLELEQAGEADIRISQGVLKDNSANATFFVAAGYYADRGGLLDLIDSYEIASLGWRHSAWKRGTLSRDFQQKDITEAHGWFRKKGHNPVGFRAPFLKTTRETYQILEDSGYLYDSSQSYGLLPYRVGDIWEVPVSMNFDLYWSDRSMGYSTVPSYLMFQKSHQQDGLFTIYAHTKNAAQHLGNFSSLIAYARARDVWFPSARETVEWWQMREGLVLDREGRAVTVRNTGARPVKGATLKVLGDVEVEGAVQLKKRGDATYAVLPVIPPGGEVRVLLP